MCWQCNLCIDKESLTTALLWNLEIQVSVAVDVKTEVLRTSGGLHKAVSCICSSGQHHHVAVKLIIHL